MLDAIPHPLAFPADVDQRQHSQLRDPQSKPDVKGDHREQTRGPVQRHAPAALTATFSLHALQHSVPY